MCHKPRVLVGAPFHASSSQYLPELLEIWKHWPKFDIDYLLVYNGVLNVDIIMKTKSLLNSYMREGLKLCLKIIPNGHLYAWGPLCDAQNFIVRKALSGNYDYILWNEVTRIPQLDSLSKLIECNLPIVGALYKDTWHPGYFCVYSYDFVKGIHVHAPYLRIDSITRPTQVDGIGFGFTLIDTKVLYSVQLRSEKYASDTYFFNDCKIQGIHSYVIPIFVENVKVERDINAYREWMRARSDLLMIFTK